MSDRILLLHIGTPKTATTTIQKFCYSNSSLLKEKGICYPAFPFTYPPKAKSRNGLFLGTIYRGPDGLQDTDVEIERLEQGLNILHDAFKTCDKVLLSDEGLFTNLYKNDCAVLKTLYEHSIKNNYKIHILVYLRRQDKFIESFWNQRVKAFTRLTTDFESYARNYFTLDYCAVLQAYENILGKDALTVHRFSDLTSGKGVLYNFLSELGIELTDDFKIAEESSNTGLNGNATSIKFAANKMQNITPAENYFIRDSLLELSVSSKDLYKCSEFSVEERAAFMNRYEEGNRYIADHYMNDGMPLFSEDYSGPPKRTTDNPEFIDDIIRSSYYSDILLLRKIQALEEADQSMKSYERRIKELERIIESHEKKIDHLRHPIKTLFNKLFSQK